MGGELERADEKLHAAHHAIAERDRLTTIRALLAPDLAEAERELPLLQEAARKEQADAERYRAGVWAFIYDVFKDREARLSKEEHEAAAAHARAAEGLALRDRLAEEIAELDRRLAALATADADLAAARAGKEAVMLATFHPDARALELLAEKRAASDRRGVELDEALAAGMRVHGTLTTLLERLSSASTWSSVDMFSDSLFVSAVKRGRMDEARSLGGIVQAELKVFQRELGDLGLDLETTLNEMADRHRYLDTLFDNVFTDWAVAKRIDGAEMQTRAVYEAVGDRLNELRSQRAAVLREEAELAQRRIELLAR